MFITLPQEDFPYLLSRLTAPHLGSARVYNLDFPDEGHKAHDAASPEKVRRRYNMSFPVIVRKTTPFDHMGWFAKAQGHAPPGIFDVPHTAERITRKEGKRR